MCGGAGGRGAAWKLGTGPASLSGFFFGMCFVGRLSEQVAPSVTLKAWIWKWLHAGDRI